MEAQQFERSPRHMALRTARQVREQLALPAMALQDREAARALEPTVRALTTAISGLYSAEVASGQAFVGCMSDSVEALQNALTALSAADAIGGAFGQEVASLRQAHTDLEPALRMLRTRIVKPSPLPPQALLDSPAKITTINCPEPEPEDDLDEMVTTRPDPRSMPAPNVEIVQPAPVSSPSGITDLAVASARMGLPRPVRRSVSNRREFPRVFLDVDIDFQSETNFYTGFAEDISAGELFIATYNVLPMDTRLTVAFTLPDGGDITVDARVCWVREPLDLSSDMSPGMGVMFENLLPKEQAVIEKFISARPPLFYDD